LGAPPVSAQPNQRPSAEGAGAGAGLPVFGLRKTWVDPGPGIAMVQIHYTWTPQGAQPDWADAEEAVLAPQPGTPGLRTAVVDVPRFVEGASDYSLHHFFFVVGAADRVASPVFTEDIASREITYQDPTGEYTSVGVVWSAVEASPELAVPNYTSTAMDGLSFQSLGAGSAPEHGNIYEFVRAQPLPHVFRGMVWGVRGSQIRYGYHLIRQGSPDPAGNSESWEDNGGSGWTVDL
jgi:hypothetical protein